jgi:hypothetical protein
MPLTFAVTDNQNGTGATATISGSDAGSANTVYTCPLGRGSQPPLPWLPAASRNGDGAVSLPVQPGYYLSYVQGQAGHATALAPPLIFGASAVADSVYQRIMLAIQAKVQALWLNALANPPADLPASNVVLQPEYNPALLPGYPCVLICPPQGIGERVEGLLNVTDDIGYPVAVTIIDMASPKYVPPYPSYFLWRERIFRILRWQTLRTVDGIWVVRPEPQGIAVWKGSFKRFYSGVVFRCVSREGRGG